MSRSGVRFSSPAPLSTSPPRGRRLLGQPLNIHPRDCEKGTQTQDEDPKTEIPASSPIQGYSLAGLVKLSAIHAPVGSVAT
jgi:hypothetical protein